MKLIGAEMKVPEKVGFLLLKSLRKLCKIMDLAYIHQEIIEFA
jgi:hypothetical protein